MKHLFAFIILVFLASCGSDDSSTATQTTSKTPPPLALFEPSRSPGTDATPTLRVSGVKVGSMVTLHKDPSCDTQTKTSDPVKVEGGGQVLITSKDLTGDTLHGEVTFYAAVKESKESDPVCLSAGVSYAFDLVAPNAPGALVLEDPSTSPSTHLNPTLKVSGVESGAIVTLYSDDTCNTKISNSVQVVNGESTVSITTKSLGDGDQDVTTILYADQRDEAGNKSPCSRVSVRYVLDVTAPMAPSALVLEEPQTNPGTNLTPIVKVSGVEERATVTLYSDNSCKTQISDEVIVEWRGSEVSITSHSLGDGSEDVEVSFYALQKDRAGNQSPCSTANLSYGFAPPVFLRLETGSYFYDDPAHDTLELSATFKRGVVNVTGTPRIELTLGTTTKYATYVSGSGTSTLVFSYDVSSDDYDNDGIEMASTIDLGGGEIKNGSNEDVPVNMITPDNLGRVWINFRERILSNSGAFAFLKKGGSVVTWGNSPYGGNSSGVSGDLASGVSEIFSNYYAFAALKDNGSVVTWGLDTYGGDSSSVSGDLASGVSEIFSTRYAVAALKSNGSVVTWGFSAYGGNSSGVSGDLASGVTQIFSTNTAFAALKDNGSVVTWGDSSYGGDSSGVSDDLASGVTQIFSTNTAFAALKSNGSVVTWGDGPNGGNSSAVSGDLASGVIEIFSNWKAFAALKSNGSVVTWGDSNHGGDSSSVSGDLASGVSEIFSGCCAFAALKDNGSVVAWGLEFSGGDSSSVSADLASGVSEIFSNATAFAALKENGSVVTWGYGGYGGNSSSVSGDLASGVTQIFSTERAFAALKDNGSVVTWGDSAYGGNSSSVSAGLASGVTQIFSTERAFAALKDNGSVVTWGNSSYGGTSSGEVDLGPRW